MEKYARLYYAVRRDLGISWTEYAYLDMIHQLSRDRWCNKSLKHVGDDLGLDRANVFRMRNRLIAKDLVVKDALGRVRTSVTYAKRLQKYTQQYQNGTQRSQNATPLYAKRDYPVVKTQPKNNKRYTGDISGNEPESSSGYALARERYESLKARRQ